jgi:hypothetical protein
MMQAIVTVLAVINPGCMRHDLFIPHDKFYGGTTAVGRRQSRSQHSDHSRSLGADQAASVEGLQYFARCIRHRRRDDQLLAGGLGSRIGHGTQSAVTRFMGLIVAAMGMQFVLTGLKIFFKL